MIDLMFCHQHGYPRSVARFLGMLMFLIASLAGNAFGQLRLVTWNTSTSGASSFTARQSSFNRVLSYLGQETVNGIARNVDVLILQEQSVNGITLQKFANELNTITGSSNYAAWTQNPYNIDGMQTGFVYNLAAVQVVFEDWSPTDSSRSTSRICLRPVGYGEDADLWVYNTHFKSGTASSDQIRRRDTAIANRWQTTNGRIGSGSGSDSGVPWGSDFLVATANIVYAGDFNQQSSYEDAGNTYPTMMENPYEIYKFGTAPFSSSPPTTGYGQAVDPLGQPGSWHDNTSFKSIHTQNPAGSGFVGGGMDDRFDFQMTSTDLVDGEGTSYLGPGVGDCPATVHSYRTLGNNGTHALNGAITTGTGAPSDVLVALATASDHLPVVADYQLPAKMSVQMGTTPGEVLVGASISESVTISNTAAVNVSLGADELDYQVSSGLGLSGAATGTVAALASGNSHLLVWDTASAGHRQGMIQVTSGSQAVADGSFQAFPSIDVLDHAHPSFHPSQEVHEMHIDFGVVAPGTLPELRSAALWNLEQTAGYTAALDLDSIEAAGAVETLHVDLVLFFDLASGESRSFQAMFDRTASGVFSTTYFLSFSDENLSGEISDIPLNLHLSAAVALPGDANLDGMVNVNDATILADNWGGGGIDWSGGDFNSDGCVNAADASILAANWGNILPLPEHAAPVPESGTLGMAIALATALVSLRKRNGGIESLRNTCG
ncbi:MAG: hypothetical protein JW719_02080 [Pirellulales bacterium]|nr:hypothetical protein [Pirellulales bacterium]